MVSLVQFEEQIYIFIITIVSGLLAGLLFDLYRMLAVTLKLKKRGIMLGDILFWLILTLAALGFLLLKNQGDLRIYIFMGLTVGAICYLRYLSKYMLPVIAIFFRFIKKIIGLGIKLLNALSWLVGLPFRAVFLLMILPLNFGLKTATEVWFKIKNKKIITNFKIDIVISRNF